MRICRVDEHRLVHTCPANDEPHPVDIRRTVVHVTDPQPCLAPVIIRSGDTVAVVDCGRHEPSDRQCGNCRVVVTTGTVTIEDLGYQGPDRHRQDALFEVPA